VWEEVWTVHRLTDLARELSTDWDRMQATAHETIDGAGRQLRDLAAREARIVDAIEAGGELDALTTRLTEIAAERSDLQVSLSDAEALIASSPPGLPADLPALLEELRASAQTWPRQEQNVILRSAIDRIEMHADGTYTIQPGRRIPGRM
jgi:ABC-type transporter Mla subunit MlaD